MVQVSTLVGIAGVGGLTTALVGYALHGILQKRVKDSPVYKEAMKIINYHPSSIELLGKPVKSDRVDISNTNNILSVRLSTLEVPVYGPKSKGILYICADRQSAEDQWSLYRLDLEVNDNIGGRVTIVRQDSPIPVEG